MALSVQFPSLMLKLPLFVFVLFRFVLLLFLFVCFFLAEDETNLFISRLRTCSTNIFPHLTNQIIVCGVVFAVLFVLA